jgi:ribosome-associated translation inhibitor RaiA
MTNSPALTERIEELATKLEEKNPRVTRCRITVEADSHRAPKRNSFGVRLDVAVSGAPDCVVDRHHDTDVFVAVRDAFAAMEKQLEPLHA